MPKLDPTVKQETAYIAALVFLFSILMQAVFLMLGKWDLPVFHPLAVIIPLLFPRVAIAMRPLFKRD